MNIHHLELFHYVARHGGISRAVRHMPYGIQQPAVSSQILQLEQDLGVKLFERTPFKLTTAGEELQAFVAPFFDNLETTAERISRKTAPHLRIGASELVLRDHLPAVINRLREHEPKLRLSLRSGFQPQMESWLIDREIDLAITPLESRPPAKLNCLRLLRVPIVLLVPRRSKVKDASELWKRGLVDEPLISLPAGESASRIFQRNLKRLKVDWPVSIEASSLELITRYVANGYGVGVSVDMPGVVRDRDVRLLPLPDFDPIEIAILWRGDASPLIQTVLDEGPRYVAQHWPQRAVKKSGEGRVAGDE
ncbi:MAG TPA: LysR family transcriptional regulator [Candidatus Didemnitutus sp.]|jgi:DNA-binding transcriptional LysR family regulator